MPKMNIKGAVMPDELKRKATHALWAIILASMLFCAVKLIILTEQTDNLLGNLILQNNRQGQEILKFQERLNDLESRIICLEGEHRPAHHLTLPQE